jgi:hypothetical protein
MWRLNPETHIDEAVEHSMVDLRSPIPDGRVQKLVREPWNILLLDLFGALVTSLATALLLASERVPTGVPSWILYAMAAIALGFACFDAVGLFLVSDPRIPLAVIAILNLIYCVASILICCVHASELTLIGTIYFSFEVVVVAALACWEWNVFRGSR